MNLLPVERLALIGCTVTVAAGAYLAWKDAQKLRTPRGRS